MIREWLNSNRWLGRLLCRLTRGKDSKCGLCGERTWWLGVLLDQTNMVICEECDAWRYEHKDYHRHTGSLGFDC